MAFSFQLGAVLRLRERKEEAEERTLVAIGDHRRRLEELLRRVEQDISSWTARKAQEVGVVLRAADQQASYARYKSLSDARVQLKGQIQQIDISHEEQKEIYLAARREREVLSELNNQQNAVWQSERSRRELREVEDLFTAKRSRR